MSKEIDEKVVSLDFNNKRFEKNVNETIASLEKLKKNLKFDGVKDSFGEIERASSRINLGAMSDAVDNVGNKFSALRVAATAAVADIAIQAERTATRLVKSLSVDQITAGWSKYEAKTSSVQTILNSTDLTMDQVDEYLNKLMRFSDETSFSFSDMTSSLSTLLSSGGDITKLIPMIEGIAAATAYAGKGSAEFSRAIFNLNQSYSSGSLKLMDWRSIQNAGVNSKALKETLIETAKEVGTLTEDYKTLERATTVSIGSFEDTLQEGWATTEVMEKAFGKFSTLLTDAIDAFNRGEYESTADAIEHMAGNYTDLAYKAATAAQQAKSFTEAIDATKDAVSSGWMKTFDLIFGNYEKAAELWTEVTEGLWTVFAAPAENRNDILTQVMDPWTALKEQFDKCGISAEQFDDIMTKVLEDNGYNVSKLLDKYGSLQAIFASGKISKSKIFESFKKLTKGAQTTTKTVEQVKVTFEELDKISNKVLRGDYGNGQSRFKKLTEEGWDYTVVQDLVNKKVWKQSYSAKDYAEALSKMNKEQLKTVGLTEEQVEKLNELTKSTENANVPLEQLIEMVTKPTGRELAIDTVRNACVGLWSVLQTVKEAFNEVFPSTNYTKANALYKFIETLHSLSEYLKLSDERLAQIKRTAKGLFNVLDLIRVAVNIVGSFLFRLTKEVLSRFNLDLFEVAARLGDTLTKFHDWVLEQSLFAKASEYVADAIAFIIRKLSELIQWFKETNVASGAWLKMNDALKEVKETIKGILDGSIKLDQISFKNTIANLKEWVQSHKVLNTIVTGVTTVYHKLVDEVTKILNKVKQTKLFQAAWGKVSDVIARAKDNFKGLVSSLKSIDLLSFDGLKNGFKEIVEFFKAVFGGNSSDSVPDQIEKASFSMDQFGEAVQNAGASVSNITAPIETLKGALKSFTDSGIYTTISRLIDEVFGQLDGWSIVLGAAGIGIMKYTKSFTATVTKVVDSVASLTGVAANIGQALVKTLGSVQNALGQWAKYQRSKMFKNIAVSIGILVGAMLVLCLIPEHELKKSAQALFVAAGIFVGIALAFTKASDIMGSTAVGKVALVVVSITAALLAMTAVLSMMGAIKFHDIWPRLGIISLLLVEIGLVAWGMAKLVENTNPAAIMETAALIGGMTIAILAVGRAMNKIAEIEDGKLLGATGSMVVILVGLVAITAAASKLLAAGEHTHKAAAVIFSIAIAITLMVRALFKIAKLPMEEVKSNLVVILGVVGVLLLLIRAVSKAGPGLQQNGGAFIGLAGSILVLAFCIKLIGDIDPADMVIALPVIMVLMLCIRTIVKAAGKSNENSKNALKGLLGLAALITVMALMVKMLGKMDKNDLKSGVIAVSTLAIVIALVTRIAGRAKKMVGLKTLIGFTSLFGVLLLAVAALSMAPEDKLKRAVAAVTILMAAITAVLFASGNAKEGNVKSIALLLGVMTAMVVAIAFLAKFVPEVENAMRLSGAVTLLLVGMAGAIWILGQSGLDWKTMWPPLLAMAFLVAACAGIGFALGQMPDVKSVLSKAAAIGGMLVVFSGITAAFGHLKNFDPKAAIKGVAVTVGIIVAIVAALGAISWIIGAIFEDDTIQAGVDNIRSGSKFLSACAEAFGNVIGSFFGGLGGGAAEAFTKSLADSADNLAKFSKNMSKIGKKGLNGVKNLAAMMLILGGADFISSWLNFKKFKLEIKKNELVEDNEVTAEEVDKETDLAESFAEYGKALVAFAESIKGITTEDAAKVEAAAKASKALGSLEGTLTISNVLASVFDAEPGDIEKFGERLTSYGESLVSFAGTIKALTDDDTARIQNVVSISSELAELEDSLPRVMGLVDIFAGTKNLGTFGENLVDYASALVQANQTLAGGGDDIGPGLTSGAKDRFLQIAEITESLTKIDVPKLGGIWSWFVGRKDLGKFGENFKDFCVSFANAGKVLTEGDDYNDPITDEQVTNLTSAINLLSPLATASNKIKSDTGANLRDLATSLLTFVYQFSSASGHIEANKKDFKSGNFTLVINTLKDIMTKVKEVEDSFDYEMIDRAKSSIDGLVALFTSMGSLDGTEANRFMVDVSDLNAENIQETFSATVDEAVDNIKGLSSSFKSAGKYCVQGFIDGIKDPTKLQWLKNAAYDLGTETLAQIKAATDEASPSKATKKIGKYCVEGMAIGLRDSEEVSKAASELGYTAMGGLESAMSTIDGLLNGGVTGPVIRPVLDLSEVQNGAAGLSGIFSNPNLGVSASFVSGSPEADRMHQDLQQQNALLREMLNTINRGGNVTIDGTKLIGWVDARLGKLNG